MKAITLWQPWASLVALGPAVKAHETRSWATSYRGPLLIHAAARWTEAERLSAALASFRLGRAGGPMLPDPLPRGAVVALARLVGCEQVSGLFAANPDHELDRAFGDWTPGRYAWRLEDIRVLPEPIPCAGNQGLWTPDERVVRLVLEQTGLCPRRGGPETTKGVPHAGPDPQGP